MERRPDSSLFVNDGSFMEKFKQQHQEKEKEKENGGGSSKEPGRGTSLLGSSTPKAIIGKTSMVDKRKTPVAGSGGKLAFSLKQKSKPVAPAIKLGEDEEEEETDGGNMSGDGTAKRPKLSRSATPEQSSRQAVDAPPSPSDPAVKKVADKLASFVAKNGRQFENVTREKNPGTSPFKFLFDKNCADYKYYEYRLNEEEGFLSQSGESQSSRSAGASTSPSRAIGSSQRSHSQHSDYHAPVPKRTASSQRSNQHSNYQIPASALYGSVEDTRASVTSAGGESSGQSSADPLSMMEFYVKKAAQEEKRRQPKHSKDEMPPPASLQGASSKKGHHMGDYIPQEELEKFLATCNDVASQKAAKEAAERAKIQADNVGHKLLSKMGWREGEGLGSSRKGMADPIMAGDVKKNNLGVGAHNPGEVTPEDDIYEQYKKRMMLGYRYRPNPLNNPRKSYY